MRAERKPECETSATTMEVTFFFSLQSVRVLFAVRVSKTAEWTICPIPITFCVHRLPCIIGLQTAARKAWAGLFFLRFHRLTEHNFSIRVYSCSSQRTPAPFDPDSEHEAQTKPTRTAVPGRSGPF